MLKEENSTEYNSAIQALVEARCKSSLKALINAAADKDITARRKAFKAMDKMPSGRLADIYERFPLLSEILIEEINDPLSQVRNNAVRILGKIKDKNALKPLINILINETEGYIRFFAVEALGKIGEASALSYLLDSMTDERGNIRLYIVDTINRLLKDYPETPNPQEIKELSVYIENLDKYKDPAIGELKKNLEKLLMEKKKKGSRDIIIIEDNIDKKDLEIIEII